MKIMWIIVVVLCGMLVPMQVAINSYLRSFVTNPSYSTLISFAISFVTVAVASGIGAMEGQEGNLLKAFDAPWWAWTGGVLTALYITIVVFLLPRMGSATICVSAIVGQLLGSLLIDHFGLFSLPKHPITGLRIIGIGLLLMSLWLVRR